MKNRGALGGASECPNGSGPGNGNSVSKEKEVPALRVTVPAPLNDKALKERYDYELARKDKLSDSVGLPVSVLIVLGGLVVTMVRGFSYTKSRLTMVFDIVVAFDVAALVTCLWYFARTYHGQIYEYLPSLGVLFEALNKYRRYYLGSDDPENAETDFEDNFRYRIIEAADRNFTSNTNRQSFLHNGIVALFALLVGTAVLSAPYSIDQYLVPAKTPVIHFDNLDGKERVMPSSKPTTAPGPQPSTSPAGPKPTFPSNVVTKSDHLVKEARGK